jgi:hypothetical protein
MAVWAYVQIASLDFSLLVGLFIDILVSLQCNGSHLAFSLSNLCQSCEVCLSDVDHAHRGLSGLVQYTNWIGWFL